MSNVLRIALVDPNDGTRESLKAMLLGMETVWLEADCSRYEFFPDVIEQTAPDVGVVSLDDNPDQAIDLIQRLSKLVTDFPQIKELDLNPVMAFEKGAVAVDARIAL